MIPFYIAIAAVAGLLAFGFCEGDDIDRIYIVIGMVLVLGMSAVSTYGKKGENIDA